MAFLLSAYLPKAVTVILVLGALFLAYEGAEKIYEFLFHRNHKGSKENTEEDKNLDSKSLEKQKVRSAIFTDFILSVEIVIIALGTVLDKPLKTQILVVSAVAIIATVGVYGIVALIVRMDDFGLKLISIGERKGNFLSTIGKLLVKALPVIVKSLAVIGTIALLLVAGGIFVHYIDFLHHVLETWPSILREFLFGLIFGIAVLIIVEIVKWVVRLFKN